MGRYNFGGLKMSLLDTPYQSSQSVQTTSYTMSAGSTYDYVPFLVTSAATLTLPLTASVGFAGQMLANRQGGQGIVRVQNSASSTASVTIAIASGDTIFGTTTVSPGQFVDCISNGQGTWRCRAAGGQLTNRLVSYQEVCPVTSFTDGGSTSGTLVLSHTIPAGAVFAQTLFTSLVGFAGDVSATATLGDGSDVDRYNTGTPNFFTTAAQGVDAGVPSGTKFHNAAIATVTLTVTTNSDFTLCKTNATGSVLVTLFYYKAI
jgi:hypothetical protein